MNEPKALSPQRLAPRCDPRELGFGTTAELEPLTEIVGQARALEAVRFAVGIRREGYNLYALGPAGIGKHTAIEQVLEQEARERPLADDWCYVHNFRERHKPIALRLPPGRGAKLREDMEQLVRELRGSIPAMLESDEYRAQMQEIDGELKEKQEQAFAEIQRGAEQEDMVILNTPHGFAVAAEWLTGRGRRARFRPVGVDVSDLTRAVRQEGGNALVLPADCALAREEALPGLMNQVRCPVVLVR